ncbi:gapA transcriptional regulator CggR [Bacillaceae bacterium]
MQEWIRLQRLLLPDLLEVLDKRYQVLKHVMLMQPVGRRTLSQQLRTTERIIRGEVNFLKDQGLLSIDPVGMRLTPTGIELVESLEPLIKEISGLVELERKLSQKLGVEEVIVVSGDADRLELVIKELGRAGAKLLKRKVKPNDIVAVMGGSTMAAVAEMMTETAIPASVTFVPARGGLGEKLEYQANTVASLMAKKTRSDYRMLHVPDRLSRKAYESLRDDPNIREILGKIRSANVVIHGIGAALTMARRRRAEPELIRLLQEKEAVAEAFGYYFDRDGGIVYKMPTLGLQLEDVRKADTVIAVAGGASKAEAIRAVMRQYSPHVLITDEGAARAILAETPNQSVSEKEDFVWR